MLLVTVFAQDRKSLEHRRDALDQQIKTVNALIKNSRKEQKTSAAELQLVKRQIALQKDLISTIRSEVARANKQVEETESTIDSLEEDMKNLKDSYSKMVQYAYRNRSSYDRLSYLFAAESFTQAYRRSRYLNQLAEYRRRQALLIQETAETLEAKRTSLVEKRKEKEVLLADQKSAMRVLDSNRKKQSVTLAALQEKEVELQGDLKKKRAQRKELAQKIREVIAAEIKRSKANNKGTFSLTPEAIQLSNKFTANKGKLPWPVERGIMVSRFGRQAHPVLKGIVIENNGVDIATDKNSIVRAVFGGTVSSVFVIPGAGKVVIIEHGAYRTVYSPFKDVFVEKGDKVKTKQSLGELLSDGDENNAHLEIWRINAEGPVKEDPSAWLFKQ